MQDIVMHWPTTLHNILDGWLVVGFKADCFTRDLGIIFWMISASFVIIL